MTRIFISHSHSDEAIAYKLGNFLLFALRIEEEDIFCSSNPDQGLDLTPSPIINQLIDRLKNSEALIVLITAKSLKSDWIPIEVGAFLPTDKPIIPILGPGLTLDDLPEPLKNLPIISIDARDWQDKVNNSINQLVRRLNIKQKVTKRRNVALEEFFDSLKARLQQEKIDDLTQKLELQERSHQKQLEELEQFYQTKIEEKDAEITLLQEENKRLKYSQLEKLLAAGKWREADQETQDIMLKVANRQGQHRLTVEDINNFPCEDLRTIDQLWLKYSNKHFGFSRQKEIYLGLGGTQNYHSHEQMWKQFGAVVGWRNERGWYGYDRIGKYGLNDPRGHLPYHKKLDSWESIVLLYRISDTWQ